MRRTSSTSSSDSDRPVVTSPRVPSRRSSTGSIKRRSRNCVRVVIAGDQCTGKSALTVRFLTRRFIGTYQNEKDMIYKTIHTAEDSTEDNNNNSDKKKTIRVELLDTTSNNITEDQSSSPALEKLRWSTAVVLVYDITNTDSYKYAVDILKDIQHEKPNHPCLLLGNKLDLEHQRAVSQSEATNIISQYSNCQHVELSAANSDFSVVSDAVCNLFSLSLLASSKPIKRRKSFVDMAKAFSTLLRTGTSRHNDNRSSS